MKTRSQSAMEYLMTYGWAILIIAVILGVLFSLGVFNPMNYAPRVPAGSCHVFRPNGPGTSFNAALVGTCSGFLPQYVAQFSRYSNCINGGYVPIQVAQLSQDQMSAVTITYWIYRVNGSADLALIAPDPNTIYCIGSTCTVNYWPGHDISFPTYLSSSKWYFVSLSLSESGTAVAYVNGVAGTAGTWNSPISGITSFDFLGYTPSCSDWSNASIANVQIYNTSLDSNEIQYLYNEGIGGAPIYLSHLVGWWPLNGDAKDYSGNGNDGTPYNISFNGSWTTGYSQP